MRDKATHPEEPIDELPASMTATKLPRENDYARNPQFATLASMKGSRRLQHCTPRFLF